MVDGHVTSSNTVLVSLFCSCCLHFLSALWFLSLVSPGLLHVSHLALFLLFSPVKNREEEEENSTVIFLSLLVLFCLLLFLFWLVSLLVFVLLYQIGLPCPFLSNVFAPYFFFSFFTLYIFVCLFVCLFPPSWLNNLVGYIIRYLLPKYHVKMLR